MPSPQGRIALVTGANRGIGREIVRQLAATGHHVLLSARDPERARTAAEELRAAGRTVEPMHLDVTDAASVSDVHQAVEDRFGRLDVLVNNAGIRVEPYGRVPSAQPLELWRETFETNLFGMVVTTTTLLPLIRRSVAGRIVNVSSLLGSVTTHSDPHSYTYSEKFKALPAYSASKSGVNSWTAHLAYELRDTTVRVNAVHPGYTRTDMNDGDGDLDVADGARTAVLMAQGNADVPQGSYRHLDQVVPW